MIAHDVARAALAEAARITFFGTTAVCSTTYQFKCRP